MKIGQRIESVSCGYQLIYLDTLAANSMHYGQLSAERLAWLDETLESGRGQALLFMHPHLQLF